MLTLGLQLQAQSPIQQLDAGMQYLASNTPDSAQFQFVQAEAQLAKGHTMGAPDSEVLHLLGRATEQAQSQWSIRNALLAIECHIHRRNGEDEMVARTRQQQLEVLDSMFAQRQAEISQDLDNKYARAQKAQEVTLLEAQGKVKSLELQQKAKSNRMLIGGLGVLMLIAIILYLQSLMKRRHAKVLARKNGQIADAVHEKETLLREIHHRVKNNLQVISSLLNLQARHVSDTNAIDALQEGRSRVRSMSLIHQHLYLEDKLTGVEMHEYVTDLLDQLLKSHKLDADTSRIKVAIQPMTLDIDTVIPLGLIINEIVNHQIRQDPHSDAEVQLLEGPQGLELKVTSGSQNLGSNTFGRRLIQTFAEELQAEVLENTDTAVLMTIRKYQRVA